MDFIIIILSINFLSFQKSRIKMEQSELEPSGEGEDAGLDEEDES